MRQRHRLLLLLALAATVLPVSGTTDAEDELKSVIVKNFLRYSTFPDAASPATSITVGVIGRSSFAHTLHSLLDGKPVNGRPVQVIEPKTAVDLHRCQLVYVATDKSPDIRQALHSVRASHILTIGEADAFLEFGGAVNLLQVDGHMGFEFDLDALTRAGVEISAKLLRLGQNKRRNRE